MTSNTAPDVHWSPAAIGAAAGALVAVLCWWAASRTTGAPLLSVHGAVPTLFVIDTLPLWGAMAGHAIVDSLRVRAHRELLRNEVVSSAIGERTLETIAGISGDAIVLFDKDGEIVQANGAAVALMAGAMRKLIGAKIKDILPDIDDRTPDMRMLRRTSRGEVLSVEWQMVANRLDGSGSFPALVSGAPVPGSDATVLIVREMISFVPQRVEVTSHGKWSDVLIATTRWLGEAGPRGPALQADLRMLAVLWDGSLSVTLETASVYELVHTVLSQCQPVATQRGVRLISEVGMESTRVDQNLIIHSLRNVILALVERAAPGSIVSVEHAPGTGLIVRSGQCTADVPSMVRKLREVPVMSDETWEGQRPAFCMQIAGELARSSGAHWNVVKDGDGIRATLELPGLTSATLNLI